MPSLRSKLARSKRLKAAVAASLLCYVAFVLLNTSRQKHNGSSTLLSPDKHLVEVWRGHPRHPTHIVANIKNETSKEQEKAVLPKEPTKEPTEEPTEEPTKKPTKKPTMRPTVKPTKKTQERARNQTESSKTSDMDNSENAPMQCPKTLKSLAKYSKWFHDKFQPKIKLFLDKHDVNNYNNLSTRGLPYGFKGQNLTVFDQILQNGNFTNPPIHGARGKQGCIRCAVVGCGGILNGSGAGEEIDGHDYVFRVNRAVSRGRFANDVGRRTTFYTFFPESQRLAEVEDKNMIAFFTMFKAYDVAYAKKMLEGDRSQRYTVKEGSKGMKRPGLDPSKLKLFHPGFVKYVSEVFLDRMARPTTGSIVVIASLHICDEVTIYGFGYDSRFTLHYYDSGFTQHTKKSTASHNVDNERSLWMKLHEEGVIRLFKRDL